jgi:hypothetical protein
MSRVYIDGRHRNAGGDISEDIPDRTVADEDVIFSSAAIRASRSDVAAERDPNLVEHPGKIGIGTWDFEASGAALSDLDQFNFGWYTNWQPDPLWSPGGEGEDDERFVPMIWGRDDLTAASLNDVAGAQSDYLLGFNEPNNVSQSNLSVRQALTLWPKLMETNLTLGSPACTMSQTLGDDSWLGRFMDKADRRGYDVDFVAVHYYSDDGNIADFKAFLKDVRQEYHKPVWVTEWTLVDWTDPGRFTAEEIADFAADAIQMLDDLNFVKRHAWFAAYDDGDESDINTELIDADGNLTAVGHVFQELTM